MNQINRSLSNPSAFALITAGSNDEDLETEISNLQGVARLFLLAGEANYLAELNVVDNVDLGRTIRELKGVDGVNSLQTLVILDTLTNQNMKADSTTPPLRNTADQKEERTPYQRFLDQLIARGKERSPLHDYMRVYRRPYTGAASGLSGAKYFYYIATRWSRVELYIDRLSVDENKRMFDTLFENKAPVEESFGEKLKWERLDDKRACRISYRIPGGYNDPESTWPSIQERLVDSMIKLERSLTPLLQELQ